MEPIEPIEYKIKLISCFADGTEKESEWKFEGIHVSYERGLMKRYNYPDAMAIGIVPSGQERLQIRAWKGCRTWDSFVAEETI